MNSMPQSSQFITARRIIGGSLKTIDESSQIIPNSKAHIDAPISDLLREKKYSSSVYRVDSIQTKQHGGVQCLDS